MRLLGLMAILLSGAVLGGQSDSPALPANYAVQFENAWVKVTSVRYGPLEKLPGHAHTPNPSAYVYLNDGPPVRFQHIGGHHTLATRPATRSGAFRVYRGLDEVHAVENTSSIPSEFLRVELKTRGVAAETFRGKFERPPAMSIDPVVHFDHPQVRITRIWAPPGETLVVVSSAEPALLVALGQTTELRPGQTRWIPPSTRGTLTNTSSNAVDFLRFDFKTQPASTDR